MLIPTHKPNVYLHVREDRKDDFDVIREIWCEDVYHVADKIHDAKLIVDLGANIGAFTTYCLEHSEAKVIAIEPEPNNLELLELNINRVDPDRVDLRRIAIADFEGSSSIEDNAGSSVLGTEGSIVPVTRIDILLNKIEEDIDIFKIDIEGYETAVLMDMSQELQNRIKFFTIEYDHDSDGFGDIIQKLSETHSVTTLGAASRGAMIFAERY